MFFTSVIMIWPGVASFIFILLGPLWPSWTCGLQVSFGRFLSIISSYIFSPPHSLSGDYNFILSHMSLRLSHFFQSIFFLCVRFGIVSIAVFKFIIFSLKFLMYQWSHVEILDFISFISRNSDSSLKKKCLSPVIFSFKFLNIFNTFIIGVQGLYLLMPSFLSFLDMFLLTVWYIFLFLGMSVICDWMPDMLNLMLLSAGLCHCLGEN